MKRQLTLLDCLGIGINGIIGTGIFLLPGVLWRHAGGRAPIAWLIVGALCSLVALCFAEAAARTDRSGGSYRYACDAFGPYVGFAVGWVTLTSTLVAYAAVSRAFGEIAAKLLGLHGYSLASNILGNAMVLPAAMATWMNSFLMVSNILSYAMVVLLCAINVIGARGSARTGDAVSAVKILSLLVFVGVGLFFINPANLHVAPHPNPGEQTGLLAAAFAGLFATTGFEFIPVPAGEAVNPRRTVPLAMVISVLGTTVIYALVQIVAAGLDPNLGASQTPLADAVRRFSGHHGEMLMDLASLLSSFGFCASSALVGPRYLEVFAEDRFMPSVLCYRSPRLGTPVWAVISLSALVLVLLSSGLPFEKLVDVSNVAVVVQYMATCLAVLVLRRKARAPAGAFVVPFGPLVPILALAGSLLFLRFVGQAELVMAAVLICAGLLIGALWRRRRSAKV